MNMQIKDYVNWKMSHDVKHGETEGNPLVLEKCRKNKELKNFRIYGNSVQDGEPTPEAPIEIESVGDLTTKNLFDYENITIYRRALYLESSGDFVGSSNWNIAEIKVDGNSFAISGLQGGRNPSICLYDSEKNFISGKNYENKTSITISSDVNISFVRFSYGVTWDLSKVQLEEGAVVTEFEPYHKYKIPVTVRGKNLYKPTRVSAEGLYKTSTAAVLSNSYGTVLDTTDATKGEFTVTQTKTDPSYGVNNHNNGYFSIEVRKGNLVVGKKYKFSCDYEILSNPLNNKSLMFSINAAQTYYVSLSDNGRLSFVYTHIYNTSRDSDNLIVGYNGGKSLKISNIMITEVEHDISYEPYIESQTTNIYLDEPLRKVGDYADYIDFDKGVVKRHVTRSDFKDLSWSKGNYTFFYTTVYTGLSDYVLCISNILPYKFLRTSCSQQGICIASGNIIRVRWDALFSTLSEWKAFINNNESYILFPRKSPKTVSVELPTLPKTEAKTMIYEINSTIDASILYGKYVKKY